MQPDELPRPTRHGDWSAVNRHLTAGGTLEHAPRDNPYRSYYLSLQRMTPLDEDKEVVGSDCMCVLGSKKHQPDCEYFSPLEKLIQDYTHDYRCIETSEEMFRTALTEAHQRGAQEERAKIVEWAKKNATEYEYDLLVFQDDLITYLTSNK